MSYTGAVFTNDDDDIVSLHLNELVKQEAQDEGRDLDRSRIGWVNIGAFSVRLETSIEGNLSVEVYPCANEKDVLARIAVLRQSALDEGAIDNDD